VVSRRELLLVCTAVNRPKRSSSRRPKDDEFLDLRSLKIGVIHIASATPLNVVPRKEIPGQPDRA
jgi:hypothetical protein